MAVLKLNRFKYMELVQQYRVRTGMDVSRDAANYTFLQLIQGKKTPLAKKIEEMFCSGMSKPNLFLAIQKKPDPVGSTHKPRKTWAKTDYLDPALFDKVLHPDLTPKGSRGPAYFKAYQEGKVYLIVECPRHGMVMHHTSIQGNVDVPDDEYSYAKHKGYCLICKILTQANPDRIQEVYQFTANFLKYVKKLKQPAS